MKDGLNLIKKHADELEKALPLFGIAKEIVRKFDGKVYNVKLDRDLEKHGMDSPKAGQITHYIRNRDVPSESGCGCNYIGVNNINICYSYNPEGAGLISNKRIVADKWIEVIEADEKSCKNQISALRNDYEHSAEVIKEWNTKIAELEVINYKLSYAAKDYLRNEARNIRFM